MKKRVLGLFLSACLIASMTGCGSMMSDIANEANLGGEGAASQVSEDGSYNLDKITFVVNGTLAVTADNGQAEFVKQWESAVSDEIGHEIKLDIQQMDHSGYVDAVGRIFASGENPDVIIMNPEMVKQYAPSGILWDMSKAYDNAKFQERMDLPSINENMKDSEGHLYGFAYGYGNGCVSYVKKAWLDSVGINADDVKTYEDYYNMLKAFREGDPDGNGKNGDTYGVVAAGFVGSEAPYTNYLPEFWQQAYPGIYQNEDGVWVDGFQEDASKEALERLHVAYEGNLIDPESLTLSTKTAREKWYSNDQTGSSGVFTYWAGTWYQTLTDNLVKNEVDPELVMLNPIAEVGAYVNREAPCLAIVDDGDGNDAREQAIFDAFIETMMDGDKVQMLWTYGAEGVHWSTEAEEFTTNAGTDKEKKYSYEAGQFHCKQSPNDENTVWKKNVIDPALVICHMTNGYEDSSDLAKAGNEFFVAHSKDARETPSSETLTNEAGTIETAKSEAISAVVVEGVDVNTAIEKYKSAVGSTIDTILVELNEK